MNYETLNFAIGAFGVCCVILCIVAVLSFIVLTGILGYLFDKEEKKVKTKECSHCSFDCNDRFHSLHFHIRRNTADIEDIKRKINF